MQTHMAGKGKQNPWSRKSGQIWTTKTGKGKNEEEVEKCRWEILWKDFSGKLLVVQADSDIQQREQNVLRTAEYHLST